MKPLPIDPAIPEIVRAVLEHGALVLEAPAGAGKTTRVPPALLDALGGEGDVLVLEPRRIAARMAAKRVAEERGERVGQTVGYTVRFEDVSSRDTRIRFLTEGVLTRRFLDDPTLSRARIVVLDEFHERHLHGDVALALVRQLRATRRPDLAVVVMSATLDTGPVAAYLGAPTVRTEGKMYDVAIEHAANEDDRPLALQVAGAVRAAAREAAGDVLVFLPGAAEIRRSMEACAKIAGEANLLLLPLHGDLAPREQDRAVTPQSRRKVVLSTNVAESSVTIDGVTVVVDSGLARVAGYAAWSGLPTLEVKKISRASAAQRAGRAGRTRPGRCVRLYTKADWTTRSEHDVPEIERLDLAQTWLELAARGTDDLEWLDPPPDAAVRAATGLLTRLGAIDGAGMLTRLGTTLLRFPLHPRQSRLLTFAETRGVAREAAVIAALIGERDIRSGQRAHFDHRGGSRDVATERSDLLAALDLYREAEDAGFSVDALRRIGLDPGPTLAVSRAASRLQVHPTREPESDPKKAEDALLLSVLAGYPDRVVKRVRGRTLAVAGGGSAELGSASAVRDAPFMVAVDADTQKGRAVVHVASEIQPEWLIELFPDAVGEVSETTWDASSERVVTHSRMVYEGLVLAESEGAGDEGEVARVLAKAAVAAGARRFAPENALDRWLARVRFAARADTSIAAPDDADVDATLREACLRKRSFAELGTDTLLLTLEERLGARARARLSFVAPERVALAGGRFVRVEYEAGKSPWIASRLQDFFGMERGPSVAEGKVPLVLHLLAPNHRAVQVTGDLAGFWSRHYPAVRKELARKYPRHSWPDDPRTAAPPSPTRHRR
jgi:ATP-dependent helicase HrpB